MALRRAVFLDRDGVLNEAVIREGKPHPPDNVSELRLTADVRECLADLKKEGFVLIVVTNQPDVARGKQTQPAVEEIHAFLSAELPLDAIYVCYHDNADRCDCRKPAPGLILRAAAKYGVDLKRSFFIGDRWSDVAAGQRAQCQTVFINHNYNERQPETSPTFEAASLRSATDWILKQAN